MKYLLIGNKGQLGFEFEKYFVKNNIEFRGLDIDKIDIGNLSLVSDLFEQTKPEVVINCAAFTQVDLAEKDFATAIKANAIGVRNLAYMANKYKSFMVHYGTDYVFDGEKQNGLYTEEDIPNPVNMYAKSKYLGEIYLAEEIDNYLLLRVSWVYGEGKQNFIHKLMGWASNSEFLKIAFDEVSVPTRTKTIVDVTMDSLSQNLTGLWHLTNTGYTSRYEYAKFILKLKNINKIVYPVSSDIFNLPAKRPKFCPMSNEKLSKALNCTIPTWEEALEEFCK